MSPVTVSLCFMFAFFSMLLMCFNEGLINETYESGLLTEQLTDKQQHMQLEMKLPLYPNQKGKVHKHIVSISHDDKKSRLCRFGSP